MRKLEFIFTIIFGCFAITFQAQNRKINIDYDKELGELNTMFKECIGAGRANEGLRADWQQQLAEIKKDCDFKYIKMHGLLTDDMGVYKLDDEGNPQYNYQYIDALYDYILEIGMKPFVEISFMPNYLASGDETIFWWKGNITPPNDYDKWKDLVENLLRHWTDRYGEEELKTWYFEVWNEPNLDGFWAGTQEEYFKLYKYTAEAVKNVSKDYRIGGPATAGNAWVDETIEFTDKNEVPIDYISTHSYGVKQGYLDEFGTSGTILNEDEWSVSRDVIAVRKKMDSLSKENLELHYTEWSSSYTPADPIHDSYHQAAYILQKLKQIGDAANSMSYWVFTDIFEEAGPRFEPFHGGFGLMNTQGIKKSAYYAYEFLNKLGETELVNNDQQSYVAKDENGDFQVLFWDFTYTLPKDSELNQTYYSQRLPAKEKGEIILDLKHIPKGNYEVTKYQVGFQKNDPYTRYLEMGAPKQLSKDQVKQLKSLSSGEPENTQTILIDKTEAHSMKFSIRENDVFLLEFKKL
ncbi:GH39 family glycosyl hydrolase [Zunongwangia atlantica]|uniref:Glycoside hydrolase n=1 Tax=Zunongwangia atlantica 22II14-10F7 TaxID=1185767 RepID=A0A1Y1SY62_9FLAO|nr:glycoside hydrolase [Zunongwangia atlantica]ORL43687.1 glycoside hydrolase [Zunongwangia atlantica 22II14-10F7]